MLSIDPITAVSLTNAIPRNDELQKTPRSSSWSSALHGAGSFRLFYSDQPNLPGFRKRADSCHREARAEAIADPLIPGVALPIKQVPILLGPGWVRVWKGKLKGPEKRGAAGN